jgi:Rrf2 family transcriptional regulator, iron-sulfur cluster assembly transcription factor
MLALSQTTGYAILALSCLDGCRDRWVLAKTISECTDISLPYLSKLLHALNGSGLIRAKRGYRGGFQLARAANAISLRDVAEAVEGRKWLPECLLGLEECSDDRACPTHEFWQKERSRIENELKRQTLRDVAEFERQRGMRLGGCGCDSSS